MARTRRIVCVAAVVCAAFALCGAETPESRSGGLDPQAFRALCEQAADAYERGEDGQAHKTLRKAASQIAPDGFHRMLLEAADDYDAGSRQRARSLLKRATRYLNPWFWLILGFVAQAMFVGRFAVQWIASERRGESVVPTAFWYLSLLGSWGLLAYAIWRQDAVIILGQAFNSIIYVRNLTLIYRKQRRESAEAIAEEASD